MEAAWDAVRNADQPPRRLAELAVAEFGPRAAAWAGWLRHTYPDAPAHGMVRLATAQAGRQGGVLAAADAGPLAGLLGMPAAIAVRVTLVLRVAAAYGHDPTDPTRADELLTLLGYDGSGGPEGRWLAGWMALGRIGRLAGRRRPRSGRRRWSPTAALRVLSTVSAQQDSLLRLAHRAARHYRQATG